MIVAPAPVIIAPALGRDLFGTGTPASDSSEARSAKRPRCDDSFETGIHGLLQTYKLQKTEFDEMRLKNQAISASQIEHKKRADCLAADLEDERARANSLEKDLEDERARANSLGKRVALADAQLEKWRPIMEPILEIMKSKKDTHDDGSDDERLW